MLNLIAITALSMSAVQASPLQKSSKPAAAAAVAPAQTPPFEQNAEQTRNQIETILRGYPPSLREVLQLDPSLLSNAEYLQLYPRLAQFLAEHPEIAHNPTFFVGEHRIERRDNESFQMGREMIQGLSIIFVFAAVVTGVVLILRTIINQSRWVRIAKTQEEVHSKLLDRLTSNEDLLAYVQSPAGKNFLESAPISLESGRAGLGSPIGRILISIQTGVVLMFAGTGLALSLRRLETTLATEPLSVIAALMIAVGIGFSVSAVIAYLFSRRMGLIQEKNDAT
jgi:hypothetical protein